MKRLFIVLLSLASLSTYAQEKNICGEVTSIVDYCKDLNDCLRYIRFEANGRAFVLNNIKDVRSSLDHIKINSSKEDFEFARRKLRQVTVSNQKPSMWNLETSFQFSETHYVCIDVDLFYCQKSCDITKSFSLYDKNNKILFERK